jgi:hypothetical protein
MVLNIMKSISNIPLWVKTSLCFLVLFICSFEIQAQTRYYVNLAAPGADNGASWADAFTNLQSALSVAQSGDSVWIAQGTYYPTSSTDRMISFEPRSGVRIFGGFAGTENNLSQRDWEIHRTILSGDIGIPGDSTDNTNNIMAFGAVEEGTLLDGLTFQGGYSEGFVIYDIYQREGCGGALYVNAGDEEAYLVVQNCRFERNFARFKGGAVFVRASEDGSMAPQFLNCVFEYNSGNDGVAVYCNGFTDIERLPDFGHCTFTQNKMLSNAPLSIVRYITAAKDDTLHFEECIFEKHTGDYQGWRNIWITSGNHIRIDRSIFRDNQNTVIRLEFSDLIIGLPKSIYIKNSMFLNNDGLTIFVPMDVKVLNCVFKNNYGGLNAYAPNTEISDCIIDSCMVRVVIISLGTDCEHCTVSNMTISNSIAAGNGAALFRAIENDEFVTYQNINVFNNDSLALFDANQFGDSVVFRNFNFIGNRFYLYSSTLTVPGRFQNSIFYGNTFITPNYYALYPSLTFENCSVDYPDSSYFPPSVTCINTLFNQDPLFRDPANHDYSLLPCSPLINAGTNAAVADIPTDIVGKPRIQGGRVDIGVFEASAFGLATVPTVSPACVGASNGSILIAPENGCEPYTYAWSPNAGTGPELNGLPPGAYRLTVTDGVGHQIMDTLQVPEAPQPALSLIANDVQCGNPSGGSLTAGVNGGTGPFSFSWLPAAADTAALKNLPPGAYALTISDALGCQDSAKASIALLGALTLSVDGQVIPCYGETGWLSANPLNGQAPFSWIWSGWAGTDALAQPLTVGDYAVTVTDAYGCTASFVFPSMTQPDSLSINTDSDPQSQINPANGTASVTTITGGMSPFSFDWSTMDQSQSVTGLEAGTYTVTVSDKNGCTATAEIMVQFMTGTQALDNQDLKLYPNPAVSWTQLHLPASAAAREITLVDAAGRVVRRVPLEAGVETIRLDLSGISAGAYWLRISGTEGSRVVVITGRRP